MAVVALGRTAVAEHHARSHRVGALDVGVVEALDVARQLAEAEVGLDALQQLFGALLGIVAFQMFEVVDTVLAGVALRHFKQLGLVAAAGDCE